MSIKLASQVVVYENQSFEFSRDEITVTSGLNLTAGTVLAMSSGKAVVFKTGITGNPVGILIYDTDATAGDTKAVMLARHAIVRSSGLVWDAGESPAERTAALAVLASLGIIAREEV